MITTLSLNACLNKMYQELSYLGLLILSGFLNIMWSYIGTNKQKEKLQVLSLSGYVLYFLTALYFHISTRIFYNLFICFVYDSLFLLSIYFRMFCCKHSITFDTYVVNCRFHSVYIFYIKFRSCETFIVTNSGAILLLI